MNNVTEIKNEKLGESYYEIKHQSGLKILVYPQKELCIVICHVRYALRLHRHAV